MPKIVIVQPIAAEGIRVLEQAGLEPVQLRAADPEAMKAAVGDAEGILIRNARLGADVMDAAPRLKVIARHGAGLENIDVPAATQRGIRVTNTPLANSDSVAEQTLGLLIALARNIPTMDRATRHGDFDIRHRLYGTELRGRTLSIVGLGNVGRRLARMAAAGLEMRVLAFDPALQGADVDGVELTEDWGRVFREGDFVCLHLPLNAATRAAVGAEELAMMKPTACLVNCARAEVVDEEALVSALRKKAIAGAAIDVFSPEPPPPDHPLLTMDNVILTPHSAAHTHEAMVKMATHAAQGIVEVLSGRPPTWPAN